jgi:HEAT repeat protein
MDRSVVRLALLALTFPAVLAGCNVERERAKRALDSPDPGERSAALERLAELGDPEVGPLVVPLLRDGSARVRKRAVATIGVIGAGPYLRQVADRLADSDLEVRLAAVRVLGDSGQKAARPVLLLALGDPSVVVRRAATAALESLGMPLEQQVREQARLELQEQISRLQRADDQLRGNAARMVGMSGQRAGLAPLHKLLKDRSPLVVRAAAWAIGRIGGKVALGYLQQLAEAKQTMDRRAAAIGLAELRGLPGADETLVSLLKDSDTSVKQAALEALARGAGGRADEDLCQLLVGESRVLARLAARLLGKAGAGCEQQVEELCKRARAGETAVGELIAPLRSEMIDDALVQLAKQGYQRYRHDAVKWVGPDRWQELEQEQKQPPQEDRPRPPKGDKRKALNRLLATFPERVPEHLLDPLLPPRVPVGEVVRLVQGLSGRAAARKWLVEVASEAPPAVRVAALETLSAVEPAETEEGPRRVVALAAGSEEAVLRRAALKGCQLLGTEKAVEVALGMLADKDFDVRSEAADCLGRLRAHRAVKPLVKALAQERSLAAIQALARIGDHSATRPILELLQEDHPAGREGERVLVLQALGLLADREAVPAIERELTHPEWTVRQAAAQALARVWRPSTIRALKLCRHDFYADVRRACELARRTVTGQTPPPSSAPTSRPAAEEGDRGQDEAPEKKGARRKR